MDEIEEKEYTEHRNLLDVVPGYIHKEIAEDHWQLGGVTGFMGEVLIPNGDWRSHVPVGESQKNAFLDTSNCTGFGYTNRIELIWHRVKGTERNFSDRWVGFIAGTKPPGNDPHTVAEAARTRGLVDEVDLPFDASIKTPEQFFSVSDKLDELDKKAKAFLAKECVPKHDWVPSDRESLKDCLRYSPLGVAVVAWFMGSDGLYYAPPGLEPSHDTTLIAFDGDNPIIFDSYPDKTGSYIKKLRADFPLPFKSKRYWLAPPLGEQLSILRKIRKILDYLLQLVGLLEKTRTTPPVAVVVPPIVPVTLTPSPIPTEVPPIPAIVPSKYDWSTAQASRHSTRLICDEEGLDYAMKDRLCATISCESGWDLKARHENKNSEGKVTSIDWGLVQINDFFHIGAGKDFPSTDYVLNNPEQCVRWMVKLFKVGKGNLWSCYKKLFPA